MRPGPDNRAIMGLAYAHSAFSYLTAAEQIARVRLIRSENVGPIGFRHLLASKSTKQKRRASQDKQVAAGHAAPLKACLPHGL